MQMQIDLLIKPNQVILDICIILYIMDSYGCYLNFLMVNQDQCSKGFIFGVKVGEANLEYKN